MAQNKNNAFLSAMTKKRLLKDVKAILKKPLTAHGIYYIHNEQNIMQGYAYILGPSDTLYETGAFFFKFDFPNNYPFSPPKVTFHTNDNIVRFHPNLYRTGKVCLSILNTWKGEQWTACQNIKTVLLTLVTLFHNKPLLCEPGLKETNVDFKPYNKIIEYKNLEVAIYNVITKKCLPDMFHVFFPFIRENVLKEKENIVKKLDALCENDGLPSLVEELYVRTYNMVVALDYDKLRKKLKVALENLS
jgi:ubiquitin-protein ligase